MAGLLAQIAGSNSDQVLNRLDHLFSELELPVQKPGMLLGCEKYCIYAGRLNHYEEKEVWVYETNSRKEAERLVAETVRMNKAPVWAHAFATDTGEDVALDAKH